MEAEEEVRMARFWPCGVGRGASLDAGARGSGE